MKKISYLALIFVLIVTLFAGCRRNEQGNNDPGKVPETTPTATTPTATTPSTTTPSTTATTPTDTTNGGMMDDIIDDVTGNTESGRSRYPAANPN